jgi:hypothetical protein
MNFLAAGLKVCDSTPEDRECLKKLKLVAVSSTSKGKYGLASSKALPNRDAMWDAISIPPEAVCRPIRIFRIS